MEPPSDDGLRTLTALPAPAGVSVIRQVSSRPPLPTASSVVAPPLVRRTPRMRLERQLAMAVGVRCDVKDIAESDAPEARPGDAPAPSEAVGAELHAANPRSGSAARTARVLVMSMRSRESVGRGVSGEIEISGRALLA